MPRWLVALTVVAVVSTSACTAESNSQRSRESACHARKALIAEVNNVGSDLFVLSRSRLEETLLRRVEQHERMEAGTSGALQDDLRLEAEFRGEVRRRLVVAWGADNGLDLKEEATDAGFDRVRDYLLRDEPTVRGERVTSSRLDDLARRNELRLGVLCGAIRPIEIDAATRKVPLPADVIAIELDERRLVRIDARTKASTPLDGPPGWAVTRGAATSPDGTRLGFVAENEEAGRIDVFVAPMANPAKARRVTSETLSAGCFSWAPAGDRILASVGFGRPDHRLQLVDLDGRQTDLLVSGLRPGALGCAAFRGDSEVLVETGEFERDDTIIQAVAAEGGPARPLLTIEHCGVLDPETSAATGRRLLHSGL